MELQEALIGQYLLWHGYISEKGEIYKQVCVAGNDLQAKILGLFSFVVAVFSGVVLVSLFALHGNTRKLFCGFAAAIFSIIMYGSPLSIMGSCFSSRIGEMVFGISINGRTNC